MPPWIQNVAAIDFQNGCHFDPGINAMAIQIVDPAGWVPTAKHSFRETHCFEFLDLEDGDEYVDEFGITDKQAGELVTLLQHALDNKINVICHCTAGMCRSGAVAELGVMMGFADTETYRQPNLRVKQKMMKFLGWGYD